MLKLLRMGLSFSESFGKGSIMTVMETNMKPGRELDALVAEKVMGWKIVSNRYECSDEQCNCRTGYLNDMHFLPNYSSDIAAAWEVAEKMDDTFTDLHRYKKDEWFCQMRKVCMRGDSAPHAICLAALKVIEGR